MRLLLRRWGVFNLVGLGGFLLQIAAIAVLTRVFGWPNWAATALGLEIAVLHNFLGHARLVWPASIPGSPRGWFSRFARYQLANAVSLGANLFLTLVLAKFAWPQELANAAAVLACSLPNFLMADRVVFHPTL